MTTRKTSKSNKKEAVSQGTAPSPAVLHQLGEVLTREASLLIDMIVPGASHVYRPTVFLANTETASTNGALWIKMPMDFLGLNYPSERVASAPVWLGLLAHEFGHWLQPLGEMEAAEKELHIPHWLVNILLDIHGEALVTGLFPGLHKALTASRIHIGNTMAKVYMQDLQEAESFLPALCSLALYYRFCSGERQFSYNPFNGPPSIMSKLAYPVASRVDKCALEMANIVNMPTKDLPKFLKKLVEKFPELVLPSEGKSREGKPGEGEGAEGGMEHGGSSTSSGGDLLPVLKRMIGGNMTNVDAGDAQRSSAVSEEKIGPAIGLNLPSDEAKKLGRTLSVRFKTPKGSLSVPAPGRLDRIAALHQDPMPFRMELPSRFSRQPSPRVVLYLDRSSSMCSNNKWRNARLAAQAIALAIRQAGGDVRAVVFDSDYYHTEDYNESILFASSLAGKSMYVPSGNTSFAWLPAVWGKFPDYNHILLTDGEGMIPVLIPKKDRRHTFAIVIPDGRPDCIAPVASKVVVVSDLKQLAGVFAFLAPRNWVG